jgi:hypothetical protein
MAKKKARKTAKKKTTKPRKKKAAPKPNMNQFEAQIIPSATEG